MPTNTSVTISVADLYHFDTDTEPGCEKIHYGSGSGSRANFDTDPDPGKNDMDPIPAKKEQVPGKSSKVMKNALIPCFVGVYYRYLTVISYA